MSAPQHGPRPLYFGQPACFGWLHGATGRGLPVLLCGPVGAEDLSAHRLLRRAAEALAAQDQPCLRFDLLGSGNSAPIDADAEADAVPGWLASLHAAADALRAATGASRIAVLGLRLGATLAAVAAATRNDIAAYAAWVPVLSGRALLREWKLLGAAGLPSLTHPDGSLESGGFHVSAATCASLSRLTLLTVPSVVLPAPQVLVIDRDDLPGAAPWCKALSRAGAAVQADLLPGFDGLLAVPHLARLPQAMLARAVGWLGQQSALSLAAGLQSAAVDEGPLAGAAWWQVDGVAVCERPVLLAGGSADEPALFALCSESPSPADTTRVAPRTAVLMLNTGAERHIGPHGQFVPLARRWAAAGALVLRLDLAGLGDSPAAPGHEEHQVYPPGALRDLRRAIAHARAQPGVQRVVAMGLCSGAFHAWEAAAHGLDLDQVVAINPLVFFRPERVDIADVAAEDHAVQQLSGEALRHLRDPARWRKLLRGEVNLRFLLATLGRRVRLAGTRGLRTLARAVGRPWDDDLAAKLRRVAGSAGLAGPAAPPRLCVVFAASDPGWALLQAGAGRLVPLLQRQGRLRVVSVPDADHTFSRRQARQSLQAALDEVLALPAVGAARRPLEEARPALPAPKVGHVRIT